MLSNLKPEIIAVLISLFSLVVAAFSLGWNIYRDVILKPKLKVGFGVREIFHENFPQTLTKLIITATNFGPGQINCNMVQCKNAPVWRRILRKVKYAVVIHDYKNPMSGQLPSKLNVGEKLDLIFPFDKDSFLSEPFTHVGLSDSFGRNHWAPRKDVREARKNYLQEFRNNKA
ncbi:MAG: hypothetical protein COT35_03790 [Nitrospirae bacterium CG08_land_8_20_14_0_20_52_24]|nr:MAG: hypothetical protein COT35_03790 [Nitrospirae bacterium CG08_land_8_20_14_0_20_52_24]